MILQRIIVFFILVGIGLISILKTDPIIKWTGRFSFAEKWFGPTGTYTFFRLGGGLLMFAGLVYLTGTWSRVMDGLFGWLAG